MRMKNYIWAMVAIGLILSVGSGKSMAQSTELVGQQVDEKLLVNVPKDFRKLTPEETKKRYLSENLPLAFFSDARNEVDLVVTKAATFFDEKDIEILKDFYKANIQSLYNKVVFSKEGIETVDKKKAVVFEFTAELTEKGKPPLRKYSYVTYALRGKRVMVFAWTCDEKLKSKWQPTAMKVMKKMDFE